MSHAECKKYNPSNIWSRVNSPITSEARGTTHFFLSVLRAERLRAARGNSNILIANILRAARINCNKYLLRADRLRATATSLLYNTTH